MLTFQEPTIADRQWMEPLMREFGNEGTESAFGSLYLWRNSYHTQFCRIGGAVVLCYTGGAMRSYGFPIGALDAPALRQVLQQLTEDARQRNTPFTMWGVTNEQRQRMETALPDTFVFEESRDDADYLYTSQSLITLAGRKLHGKRNHITRFCSQYEYDYRPVDKTTKDDCRRVEARWAARHIEKGGDAEELRQEQFAIEEALTHFEELCLCGGVLYVSGEPVAFTIGEAINPRVFDVHFEKALDHIEGLYTMINQQFARHALAPYEWVNREEDLGLDGLRRAKLSYQPVYLLERWVARLRENP